MFLLKRNRNLRGDEPRTRSGASGVPTVRPALTSIRPSIDVRRDSTEGLDDRRTGPRVQVLRTPPGGIVGLLLELERGAPRFTPARDPAPRSTQSVRSTGREAEGHFVSTLHATPSAAIEDGIQILRPSSLKAMVK